MSVPDYKINYKSDFVLTINGDAGWAIPFCIKFWTGMPSQAYFVGFDGVKYVNCRVGDTPTQLLVMFDDHHLPIGPLRMQIAYHTTIEEFPGSIFDEVTNARDVIVTIDGTDYQVLLDFTGEDAPELEFNLPAYANEAERIQNELQRQQNEAARIAAELQREQATAAAVQGAENVNAQLNGTTLTVTNRNGVSTSVNTKGEQGEQGPVGPEGPQGEQGETGISIVSFTPKSETSTTLIYTVTFSDGTTQDVAIPKGAKGDTGATGPQGPQGQTGVSITGLVKTGETETDTLYNVTFSNGTTQQVSIPKGEKGDQGPVGPQGPQGPMGDVAVITPEQQAAFTMYSVPGQNTDGPMTQKAVTDALVAGSISYDNSQSGLASNNVQGAIDELNGGVKIGLDTFFTIGKIEIDNDNSQFITTANIVGYPRGNQYKLPANTIIPFSFGVGRIQCGVVDTANNTIVFKSWNTLQKTDPIIFSIEVADGKVVGVINSLIPIYFKGYAKEFSIKSRLLQRDDGTQLSNLYINATSRQWVSTNVHADTSFAFPLKKGELTRIESNSSFGVSCCLLKDLDGMTAGSDARIIEGYAYFLNNANDVLYLVPPRDCYLYVLNYTKKTNTIRYPSDIRTIGSSSDIASDTKYSSISKQSATKITGSFYINATTKKWVSNVNAEVYFFALEKDDIVTIEANSKMDASIAFIKPINRLTYVGDDVEYAVPYTAGVTIAISTRQTFNISEDCLLYVFYNGASAVASNRYPAGIYIENRNPLSIAKPNLDNLLNTLYRYNGETLKFTPNTFGRRRIATLPAWGNYKASNGKGLHQGMAVFNNYICLFTYSTATPAVVKIGLFDLPTATLLSTITLPYSTYARPHGNVLSFGRTYHSSNSIVPLLYISQWEADSERGVLVYDIVLNGSTYSANLVQAIIPNNIDGNIFGNGHADWVVDAENGFLYSVVYGMAGDDAPYTQDDTTNPTAICKFAIPSVSSTVETLVTTNDIIEHFKTSSLPFRQGVCVCNGKMMIQRGLESGSYTQWLETAFVNLAAKMITTRIPLVAFGGEPEGIAVYNSHLVMGWRNDANIYQFEFD